MSFGHEKLDLYRAALEYVGWAYKYSKGKRVIAMQRISSCVPLNPSR
jgi:hypothetical protein